MQGPNPTEPVPLLLLHKINIIIRAINRADILLCYELIPGDGARGRNLILVLLV